MTRVFYTNSPPTDIPESTLKIEQWHNDSISGQKRLANYLILLTGGHDSTLETFTPTNAIIRATEMKASLLMNAMTMTAN